MQCHKIFTSPVFELISCRTRGLLVTIPLPLGRKSLKEREDSIHINVSEHSIQWLLRKSPDKIWAVLGTPVSDILSFETSYRFLSNLQISEQSILWLLRIQPNKHFVLKDTGRSRRITLRNTAKKISLSTSFGRLRPKLWYIFFFSMKSSVVTLIWFETPFQW